MIVRFFNQLSLIVGTALIALVLFQPRGALAIDIERVKSPGGIEAWLVRDSSIPVISFNFAFRGGASVDPVGKEGRAEMVSGLLDEGAGDMTSQVYQRALEDIAARIRFSSSTDRFRGSLRTLSVNRNEAFRLLALAVNKPRFDARPVERIRAQIIAGLRSSLQNPDDIAARAWYGMVFPNHPYGRPNDGTIESVKAITIDNLKEFTSHYFVRRDLVVGVAGDITAEELKTRLDQVFGQLPTNGASVNVKDAKPAAVGKQVVVERDIPQSVVLFGHAGLARTDPDWYPAYVMMQVLGGGGLSSRLTEEVREKRGLAYSVYSYLNPYDHSALIMGGVATANARVAESLKVIRAEWRRMADHGLTAEELASTKTYINGSFPLRLDSTRRIAGMLLAVQINRLGINYLNSRDALMNKVTSEDIRRVAKRLLKADALTVVVVGKPEGLRSTP